MSMSKKYLMTEKKISPAQISDAIEQGSMAFWATIDDIIPQDAFSKVSGTAVERELLKAMTKAVNSLVK